VSQIIHTVSSFIYIVNRFPEIVEQYGDFLSTLNINFDMPVVNELNFDVKAAEKYIVSLKLQRYIARLNNDKKAVVQLALSGDAGAATLIKDLDNELKSANEKLEKLMNME